MIRRSPRWRRLVAVPLALIGLLATQVGLVVTASPAQAAVAAFSSPVRVTPNGCWLAKLTFDRTGRGRGFTTCGITSPRKLVYVEGSGSTWQTRTIASGSGMEVLATADDGINTYALVHGFWPTTTDRSVRVVVRSRTGAISSRTLAATPLHIGGSIIAYGGKWWAVWSVPDGGCGCNLIWTARTMLTPYSAHVTPLMGSDPFLANRGSSALLIWSEGGGSAGDLAIGYPTATAFTTIPLGKVGWRPSVTTTGGVIRFTYLTQPYRSTATVHFVERVGSRWVERTFAYPATNSWTGADALTGGYDPEIPPVNVLVTGTATSPIVSLAFTTVQSATVTRAAVLQRVGGVWSSRIVPAGVSSAGGSAVSALGQVNGRLQLVLTVRTSSATTWYDVIRRQTT